MMMAAGCGGGGDCGRVMRSGRLFASFAIVGGELGEMRRDRIYNWCDLKDGERRTEQIFSNENCELPPAYCLMV